MKNPIIPGLDIPIRTIYCIGRNYENHAKELGNEVPDNPIVFLKPLGAICYNEEVVQLPRRSMDVQFEAEIVVAISREGKKIPETEAAEFIAGYGIGIDFTARDLQLQAKAKGHPWTVAKGFDGFAPISTFISSSEMEDPANMDIKLFKNGFVKQHGNSSEMVFPIHKLIAYLSSQFTLYEGDLIFTGTPKGVGKVEKDDVLAVMLNNGQITLTVNIE